jgi:hypothetical protein
MYILYTLPEHEHEISSHGESNLCLATTTGLLLAGKNQSIQPVSHIINWTEVRAAGRRVGSVHSLFPASEIDSSQPAVSVQLLYFSIRV